MDYLIADAAAGVSEMSKSAAQQDDARQDKPKPDKPKPWKLTPAERGVLGAAAAVLSAAAAIVQVVGTTGESPGASILLAAATIAGGGLVVVIATRVTNALRGAHGRTFALLICGVLVTAGAIGGVSGYVISRATHHAHYFPEVTDNRLGTQVFSDPEGGPVAQHGTIPYDTHVLVKCWATNQSGMQSVNAFYLIETAPWTSDYAPADTFANGDLIGRPGSTVIDSAVPRCG